MKPLFRTALLGTLISLLVACGDKTEGNKAAEASSAAPTQ